MSRTLRLGMPLALDAGREVLVRLVFMAVGVGLGIALLLLSLTAPHALWGRYERMAWQDAAYTALSPETDDDPVVESVDGALFLAVSDYHDGRPMIRTYLAALGDDPPVPPGPSRTPGPGEVARVAGDDPAAGVDAGRRARRQVPGRVTMTVGPDGLAHNNDLGGSSAVGSSNLRAYGPWARCTVSPICDRRVGRSSASWRRSR
ncbi:hypothetical protein ACVCAH_25660 [Micromonospora sp. LZ34]